MKIRLITAFVMLLLLSACWPVQQERPIPDNQRQAVECAFARLNCEPGERQ